MVINQLEHGLGQILLRPNRSASWRLNKLFITGLGGVIVMIGCASLYIGAWMVLPFAGLELALVAYFLCRVSRATQVCEVINVEKHQLTVEAGIEYPSLCHRFPRGKAYFRVIKPQHPLSGATVLLCTCEQKVELGAFLNPDDKRQLIQLLRSTTIVIRQGSADNPILHA